MYFSKNYGDVAQLARALRWQRRGHRFEPGILHRKKAVGRRLFLLGGGYN